MKKPAGKINLRFLPRVCNLIRSKRAQSIHGIQNAQNLSGSKRQACAGSVPPAMIYPTPPPFSSHVYENNEVTSKKTNYACENKQLTSRTLAPNPRAVSI